MHAKAAAFCNDALGTDINCQQSYRSKISASKELAPERDRIAEEILNASYIQGNELHRKRYRREAYFLTTFLQIEGIDPDSNRIERTNHTVVSARDDGGGNRTNAGMEANSILFTVRVTSRMNGESFFDVLRRSIGGG